MNEQGFDLKFKLPAHEAIKLELNSQQILNNMAVKNTREVTKYKRSSGLWGTICTWVNTDDWGWDEYQVDEDYYVVVRSRMINHPFYK